MPRHHIKTSVFFVCVGAAGVFGLSAGMAPAQTQSSAQQRATALVAKMTLAEKASQLINSAPSIPRLGLADYQWWSEALHGYAFNPDATNYPEPIGLAAAFDAPLLNRIAQAISREGIAASNAKLAAGDTLSFGAGRSFWSPNLNIFRDPRWGRGQETYGEDPFLTARMGVAYITGLQGPDPSAPRIIATPKHFAVHSGPESTRHIADAQVSLHDLRDTYLPAFRAAIVEGHAGSIMCAYSSLNGQPDCANDFLLQDTLRKAWGFKGLVVSDCGAVDDIWKAHKFVPDVVAASAAAIRAGMDNECAVETIFSRTAFDKAKDFIDAVQSGKLPVDAVDQAVIRGLVGRIETGSMDRGPNPAGAAQDIDTAPDRALALSAAEKSIVLLKNDGVLPLDGGQPRVLVVGPLADARRVLRGNYTMRDTSELPSVFDALKSALPHAKITLVPAGESLTDGNVVPASALLTADGKPGVTVRYFAFQPDGKPASQSLIAKFMHAMQGKPMDTPVATQTEPKLDYEIFSQKLLPDGGVAIATGYLVAPISGTYRVGVRTLVGSFQIGDQKPVNVASGFNPTVMPVLQTMELTAGKRVPFTFTMRVPILQFAELNWQRISTKPEADLAHAARDADVIVAVVGLNSTLESEESSINLPGFKGGDRTTLDLPEDQITLLKAAKATGKKLVVVNMSGSAVNLDWAKQNANAIVQAWYPGEAGGVAIGKVLSGEANPAGRLPVTFYRDVSQLPAFSDYAMKGRTYRYFEGAPVYPFGYGLSYTQFAYSALRFSPDAGDAAHGLAVEARVANTGKRAGEEVAQLYLQFPNVPGVPKHALRGFTRLSLAPGQAQTVRFKLSPRDISAVSESGVITTPAGSYKVFVGGGQPESGLPGVTGNFTITTPLTLPD